MAISNKFFEENLIPLLSFLGTVVTLVITIPKSKARTIELTIGIKGAKAKAEAPKRELNSIPTMVYFIFILILQK